MLENNFKYIYITENVMSSTYAEQAQRKGPN